MPSSLQYDLAKEKDMTLALNVIEPSNANVVKGEALVHPYPPRWTIGNEQAMVAYLGPWENNSQSSNLSSPISTIAQ